jgi:glyoxylase-like metal-dependent hydrolase (beta-lactamase superfamily II)
VAALEDLGVALVRADNPGPFTLTGTNTWLAGRDPAWVIDPGPALRPHLDAVLAEAQRRGGVGGIALTHGHGDHADAIAALRERSGSPPVAAARGDVDLVLADGDRAGPLEALATPGHAPDHLAFVFGAACFTGDAVLGEGSVYIDPQGGGLAAYLDGLRQLRERELVVLCPGHGPPVWDAAAKLDEYVAHRLDRERRLLEALADGVRTEDELLDRAWSDAPAHLRPAAAVTLRTHLGKLRDEGRLPANLAGWPDNSR